MGLWSSLIGKKVHCTGCGAVLPIDPKDADSEVYCSDVCRANYRRLSTLPPPPLDEAEDSTPDNTLLR